MAVPSGAGNQARRGLYDTDRYVTTVRNCCLCVNRAVSNEGRRQARGCDPHPLPASAQNTARRLFIYCFQETYRVSRNYCRII